MKFASLRYSSTFQCLFCERLVDIQPRLMLCTLFIALRERVEAVDGRTPSFVPIAEVKETKAVCPGDSTANGAENGDQADQTSKAA
jgi:hypothetical protein